MCEFCKVKAAVVGCEVWMTTVRGVQGLYNACVDCFRLYA